MSLIHVNLEDGVIILMVYNSCLWSLCFNECAYNFLVPNIHTCSFYHLTIVFSGSKWDIEIDVNNDLNISYLSYQWNASLEEEVQMILYLYLNILTQTSKLVPMHNILHLVLVAINMTFLYTCISKFMGPWIFQASTPICASIIGRWWRE